MHSIGEFEVSLPYIAEWPFFIDWSTMSCSAIFSYKSKVGNKHIITLVKVKYGNNIYVVGAYPTIV